MDNEKAVIRPVAHIRTDFSSKFGIPRQSGLVGGLCGRVVFEREYRSPEAVRELEGFSHIWLIWQFSECVGKGWHPTVRPPKLGGNRRVGVFASRSPFRPNNLALSSVKLEGIDYDCPDAPVLIVSGADILDGTPVFDIKPYVPLSDCHADASEGYTAETKVCGAEVDFPPELLEKIAADKREALMGLLQSDPRPGYSDEAGREYGLEFAGYNIVFFADGDRIRVAEVTRI